MEQTLTRQEKAEQTFNTAGDLIGSGETVRAIQTSYATAVAVQKPRDLIEVEAKCLKEASLAGEACYYGWGVGQNRVEGPSIECAMIAVRNWGNSVVEMKPIHETSNAYIMEAAFVDLETGFTYTRQFKQSKKYRVYGKMDDERKDDVRFQIGQSKSQRNVVLKALPKWLVDKMLDEAKKGVREKLEKYIKESGIESARRIALDALIKLGVTQERIEDKYNKKYGAWDLELLVVLKGDIRALQDGAESASNLFPEKSEENETPEMPNDNGLSTEDMTAGDKKDHQEVSGKATTDDKTDSKKNSAKGKGESKQDGLGF